MKEFGSYIINIIVVFIFANILQFVSEYLVTSVPTINFNSTYEILYIFISLLWAIILYIEFSDEFFKELGVGFRLILYFCLGYFGMLVGMLTIFGVDIVKDMLFITTMVYLASFIICSGITFILVKKMKYTKFN